MFQSLKHGGLFLWYKFKETLEIAQRKHDFSAFDIYVIASMLRYLSNPLSRGVFPLQSREKN